jgi:hypothetical protein
MNREILGQIVKLLGRELINRGFTISENYRFSFNALKKEDKMLEIEEAIREKKSNTFIAHLLKVNARTMRRYKAKSLKKK